MDIQRIQLQQLANTRDLAGMPAEGQRAIRAGRLLRSGELWGASPEDVRRLQTEHNLRVVVDFRTLKEQQERPDPAISGVRYISLPILSNEAMGVTHEKKADQDVMKMLMGSLEKVEFDSEAYMAGLYRKMLESDFSRNQYGEFFKILLQCEDGAVLWHCTAGKDRAGVGAALVLEALGTPREQIMQDFLMTNAFTENTRAQQMARIRERTGSEAAAKQLEILFSVHPSYLEAVWKAIDTEFGGSAAFLQQEMGVGEPERQRLLQLYTE